MTVTYSTGRDNALSASTAVSNLFIAEHSKDAPASFLRVYLYALMQFQNQAFCNDDIALELGLTDAEVKEAFEYWQRAGLLTIVRDNPMHIDFSRPKSAFVRRDNKYADLLTTVSRQLASRSLTASDLKKIYDWIEVFGLEERVVPVLVQYCIDTKGPSVSVAYIDSVAKGWADAKILTTDDAAKYISRHTEYYKGACRVLEILGRKRSPSQAEVDIYTKWREEYHLAAEVIESACSQTLSAGTPTFGYLSGIIDSLHQSGVIDTATMERAQKDRQRAEDLYKEMFMRAGLASRPNREQKDRIEVWRAEYHISDDILLAMSEFARSATRPFAFMCKAALYLHNNDLLSPDEAKAALMDMQTEKQGGSTPAQGGYMRRKYTAEDLAHIGVNIDEED